VRAKLTVLSTPRDHIVYLPAVGICAFGGL
jgi:hypothetical protein